MFECVSIHPCRSATKLSDAASARGIMPYPSPVSESFDAWTLVLPSLKMPSPAAARVGTIPGPRPVALSLPAWLYERFSAKMPSLEASSRGTNPRPMPVSESLCANFPPCLRSSKPAASSLTAKFDANALWLSIPACWMRPAFSGRNALSAAASALTTNPGPMFPAVSRPANGSTCRSSKIPSSVFDLSRDIPGPMPDSTSLPAYFPKLCRSSKMPSSVFDLSRFIATPDSADSCFLPSNPVR
mmetsp:Transcript_3578/g.12188  ORF Transcript_3578/g.12188 Transcript_3578/m.12188 type:complete len:243 (+) Transcript_3578:374-1102(+)